MNVDVLCGWERAYLLGLYFADGWIRERRSCGSATFNLILQGNELEIADRVAEFLRRTGLMPITCFSKRQYCMTVSATAWNLVSVFGRKRCVCSFDDNVGLRWLKRVGGLEVAFIAGLLDGDGCVRASLVGLRDSIFGSLEEYWVFGQTKYPFLVDFICEYVNSLARGGATIVSAPGGRKKRVLITATGRETLLRDGIAEYSCKVAWFLSRVEKLKRESDCLRSRFLTTGQVARRVGTYVATVDEWCRRGYLKHMLIRSSVCRGCGGYRYIIPVEEAERLETELSRERGLASRAVEDGGIKLVDVAKMLNVHRNTLEKWVQFGKLRATLVVKGRRRSVRGGRRYYVIPREEVERLRHELCGPDDC